MIPLIITKISPLDLSLLVPFFLFAVSRKEDLTTSDGQGLNWKWLTGLAISIIAGCLLLIGALVRNIVNDKETQLCAIDNSIKTVVQNQAALKETLTKVEINQSWVMDEMKRVKMELQHAYPRGVNGDKK